MGLQRSIYGGVTPAQLASFAPLAVPVWLALTVYKAGQEALNPSGQLIVRIANGTSRASYDATEAALWTFGTTLTVDGVVQSAYSLDTTPVTPADIGAQPVATDLTAIAALTPTNNDLLQRKSGAWTNRTPAQVTTDLGITRTIVEYTTAGTTSGVTVPAGALGVYVSMVSGGGGGGAGRRGAAASIRCGGGGGACGGFMSDLWVPAALLGATYSVVVAAGGTAGAAATSDSTNGGAGGNGASSSFTSSTTTLLCTGGAGGGGGTATSGTASPFTGGPGVSGYGAGAAADTSGGAGQSPGDSFNLYPFGGASGGGITSADVAGAGGAGAAGTVVGYAGAAGGVVGGASPGAAVTKAWLLGYSGGGGAASKTAVAQTGATGVRGAGGSGGGASLNGFNSGAGGAGGPGYIRLVFVFA